jgi:pyruvate dehydrogenase E2 component (dihydrolipoamide acetyltransferase)
MGAFLMPSLGADMEAGRLVEWLVAPGQSVRRGDIVAVVDTQKGAIEIEVFEDGIFDRGLVEIGATVPVGTPIAEIRTPGDGQQVPAPAIEPRRQTAGEPVPVVSEIPSGIEPIPAPPPVPPEAITAARLKVTPAARRLAGQSGIDLASVKGSGPAGDIRLSDVEAEMAGTGKVPLPQAAVSRPGSEGEALSGMRAAIAAAMAHSKREIPHYYLLHHVEVTRAESWLAARNANREPAERVLLGALFIKAVAHAARKYPEFNGAFADGVFRASAQIHVGMAINIRGGGLVAPAIHDAADMEVSALMAAMRDLVTRVRAGRFRASELADPTITVSSLGERGVETLFGVIYPPQVAIVGFGSPVIRPWAEDGMIGARRIVTATLAGDHRVSDGHRGALFLGEIDRQLQQPEAL